MNTPQKEEIETNKEQMRLDYAMLFNSEKGKRVLTDLKSQFGWYKGSDIESPSAGFGVRAEDVFLKEGMKEPIRHILAMTAPAQIIDQPREEKAIT